MRHRVSRGGSETLEDCMGRRRKNGLERGIQRKIRRWTERKGRRKKQAILASNTKG